jgi:hypothetical protein
MLEAFVHRVARHPDADAFALRGGMLVRHWFPEAGRPVRDLDLVCSLPFEVEPMRARIAAVLADRLPDGVTFDDRFRVDPIWTGTRHPGLRLFVVGQVDGWSADMSADVTFQLEIWPRPERATPFGAALSVCPPATLIGRKLQVLAALGRRHWRPKDLGDVWLMLQRPPPMPVLGEAIERSFFDPSQSIDALWGSWWSDVRAVARWGRYATCVEGVPKALAPVLAEIRAGLIPFVRQR